MSAMVRDHVTLKSVAESNDAAVAMFDLMSKRQRFRRQSDVKILHEQLQASYGNIQMNELLEVLKKLQDMGFGSLVYGRGQNNKGARFLWGYSLKDIAAAAKGHRIDLKPLNPIRRRATRLALGETTPRIIESVLKADKAVSKGGVIIIDGKVTKLTPEKAQALNEVLEFLGVTA